MGHGAYGNVYKTTLGGSQVAVKLRKKEGDAKAKEEFEKEIKVMRYELMTFILNVLVFQLIDLKNTI